MDPCEQIHLMMNWDCESPLTLRDGWWKGSCSGTSCESKWSWQLADSSLSSQSWQELSPVPWKAWSQRGQCMKAYGALGEEPCPCRAEEPVPGPGSEGTQTQYELQCMNWAFFLFYFVGKFSNTLWHSELTILGSFFAMFLRAMMASTWTLIGRVAAAVPWMGMIFVIDLMLEGCPAFPRTFTNRMMFSVSPFETASERRSWMGCWRE